MANVGKKSAREGGSAKEDGGNVECREISWGDKSARLADSERDGESGSCDVEEPEKGGGK